MIGSENSRASAARLSSFCSSRFSSSDGATYTYTTPTAATATAKTSSASRVRMSRRATRAPSVFGVAEAVPDAAHGEQVLGVLGVLLDLLAQVADVDVDRPRVAEGRVAPDPGQQHLAREDPAGVAGERLEDLELDVRRLDVLVADLDGALGEVHPQLADLERLVVAELLVALGPRGPA